MADILPLDQQRIQGVPSLEANQEDAVGAVSRKSMAREVASFHGVGLRAAFQRNLTAEKYALHLDGEGDAQWLDIYRGTRLRVPSNLLGAVRTQNNQLRPIVDNYVAHLTTQRYSFIAESKPSRESREQALVDAALVNHLCRKQRWNALWASAKYIGAAFGSCPIHAMWREDMTSDPYEAVWARTAAGDPMIGARPGTIDSWVGNPWGMVYDNGATRDRLHRATYERVLPADLVRQAFDRPDLEGTTRLPSASIFHRIAAKWINHGGGVHGRADITVQGQEASGELIALLYDEIGPGIDPEYPEGRLCIVALQGQAGHDRSHGHGSSAGQRAELLWCGGLPAATFSFVRTYTHHGRADDPYGKPFISDLDDDQMVLNQLESLHAEYIRKATKAPLMSTGNVNVSTLEGTGDTLLEMEPLGPGSVEGQFLEPPYRHIGAIESKIQRVLEGMYRKGGWQAASRGDLPSGASGKAIISAQQADDSIFGPQSEQTRFELQEFCRLNWKLFKAFGDVPHVIDLVGDDLAHIAGSTVDRTMLSDDAPQFTLVSGFGVTPEADAQQLINLLTVTDAFGEPIITAKEVRELYPDRRLFKGREDASRTRERRPRVINAMIRDMSKALVQQYPDLAELPMSDPRTEQAGRVVAMQVDAVERALADDDLEAHIDTLSLLTQDTSENAVARHAAILRQSQYWQWAAQKQMAAQAAQAQPAQQGGEQQQQQGGGQEVAPPQEGGTVNSESMVRADQRASARARSA